jgi:hypothetical protein
MGRVNGSAPEASRSPLLGVNEKRLEPLSFWAALVGVAPKETEGFSAGDASGGADECVRCEFAFGALSEEAFGCGAGIASPLGTIGATSPMVFAPDPLLSLGSEKPPNADAVAGGLGGALDAAAGDAPLGGPNENPPKAAGAPADAVEAFADG